ncbi:hypothetical protein TNCV_3617941 [Trichonephila clavipes]|nr:hypothetical protein TNCV_3617941 [Trichonephila clavipes]
MPTDPGTHDQSSGDMNIFFCGYFRPLLPVKCYNRLSGPAQQETCNVADDTLIGYKNDTEVATARQMLHKMSAIELGGLPYKIPCSGLSLWLRLTLTLRMV